MMAPEIHVEQTHYYRHRSVGAHGHQEQRAVLQFRVVMHRDQDAKACDGYTDGEDGKGRSVLGSVAQIGHNHGKDKRRSPRRYRMQLGLDARVAKAGQDLRRKVGVTVRGDDEAKVHEASDPDFYVFEDISDVFGRYLALDG